MTTRKADSLSFDSASRAALSRAAAHLRAAESISHRNNFPLAYSILVLSFEELAKSIVLKLAADGVVSFDPHDKGSEMYINPKSLFRGAESHKVKQAISGTLALQLLATLRIAQLFVRMEGRKPTRHEIDEILLSVVYPRQVPPDYAIDPSRMEDVRRIRKEIVLLLRVIGKLDALKQKGFYTDLAPYSGDASRVRPATAFQYRRFLTVVRDMLEIGRGLRRSHTNKEDFIRMQARRRLRDFALSHA